MATIVAIIVVGGRFSSCIPITGLECWPSLVVYHSVPDQPEYPAPKVYQNMPSTFGWETTGAMADMFGELRPLQPGKKTPVRCSHFRL